MDNKEIGVSILCAAYNHELYIRDCLDGFVNQKTNFPFEVLIHNDASTDGTADIIREYEEKYPDIIKPIYQKENQWSKGIKINPIYQLPRAKGKYIAFCEGDDYWTDPLKLQKQYEAMEANSQCSICVHKVQVFSAEQQKEIYTYPLMYSLSNTLVNIHIKGEDYIKYRIQGDYLFQTSSYFIRKNLMDNYYCQSINFREVAKVGDEPLLLWLATEGDIYFMPEVMSVYRLFTATSWSKKHFSVAKNRGQHWVNNCKMFAAFNVYTNYVYNTIIQDRIIQLRNMAYEIQRIERCELVGLEEFGQPTKEQDKEINRRVRKIHRRNRIKKICPWAVPLIRRFRKIWKEKKTDE